MHPKQQTGDSTASESETGIRHRGKAALTPYFLYSLTFLPLVPRDSSVVRYSSLSIPELLLWVSAPVTKYTLTKMHFHMLFPSIILSSPSSPETS